MFDLIASGNIFPVIDWCNASGKYCTIVMKTSEILKPYQSVLPTLILCDGTFYFSAIFFLILKFAVARTIPVLFLASLVGFILYLVYAGFLFAFLVLFFRPTPVDNLSSKGGKWLRQEEKLILQNVIERAWINKFSAGKSTGPIYQCLCVETLRHVTVPNFMGVFLLLAIPRDDRVVQSSQVLRSRVGVALRMSVNEIWVGSSAIC